MMIHFFFSLYRTIYTFMLNRNLFCAVLKSYEGNPVPLPYALQLRAYKESRIGLVTLCQHPLLLLLHDQTCLISFSRSEML